MPAELSRPLPQTDCSCTAGIIDPPALTKALSLVEERTEQYAGGRLQFCDCELGQRAQRFYAERAGNPYGKQLAEEAARRRAAYLQKIDGLQEHERAIRLDGFLPTRHNREAIAAVTAAVEQRRGLITLCGPFGTGKTGLLMAAVNACAAQTWPRSTAPRPMRSPGCGQGLTSPAVTARTSATTVAGSSSPARPPRVGRADRLLRDALGGRAL